MPFKWTIPTQWSIHVNSLILKSGDWSSVRNYRPVSLLCTVSEVLERIVHDKIINFPGPAIYSHQFGFQRKRSVLQQLLIFLHNILSSYSTKSQVDVIYLEIRMLSILSLMTNFYWHCGQQTFVANCGHGLRIISPQEDSVYKCVASSLIFSHYCHLFLREAS